jgi:uncharacterized protein (TIGR02996 family)
MRTFELHGPKAHKFWTIEVSGKSFTVTFGKVGTSGRTQTKTFATTEKAQAAADKLIREKTAKGYVETTPPVATRQAVAFEQALAEDPDDLAGWSAYADYLAEEGSPRGEFMQVQLALEDETRSRRERAALKKQEADLLKKYERDWLGPLAAVTVDAEQVPFWDGGKQGQRAPVAHRFTRGWLSRLEVHRLTVGQARALAQASQARLLRELVVTRIEYEAPVGTTQQYIDSYYEPGPDVPAGADPDEAGLHALGRCPQLGSVRLFQLGEMGKRVDWQEEEYFNCRTPGQLAHHLVKQMPNLEELYLLAHRVDANKTFSFSMPRLRVLQLYHSDSYPLDKLAANSSLTNLTTLLCHPHALEWRHEKEGAYIRLPHLRALCRSPHLKALTTLRLRLTDFGDAGAKEIVASGILKRLKVLDLHGGCITDEGARVFAGCPDLKHLDYLKLSRNALTKAGEQAITATGVKADVSSQHGDASAEYEGGDMPEYLFEGDIE